jgi:hypothetical protein
LNPQILRRDHPPVLCFVSSFMDTLAPTEDNADELMAAGAEA